MKMLDGSGNGEWDWDWAWAWLERGYGSAEVLGLTYGLSQMQALKKIIKKNVISSQNYI